MIVDRDECRKEERKEERNKRKKVDAKEGKIKMEKEK